MNSTEFKMGAAASSLRQDKASYLMAKRMLDVVGAGCGILLLLPLFIFLAIAIKLEDPKGPVLFKQTRVGRDGKTFHMFKFRSMVSNAEELLQQLLEKNETTGAMFKMKNDPRVTKVGRIIRKTSLDELSQLWNVLIGEMSLVGPRPALPREVAEYTEYDKLRLRATPGCTGLWQVSGRSNIGFSEMVELDISYIASQSILLDIKLILKTVVVMVRSKGAY